MTAVQTYTTKDSLVAAGATLDVDQAGDFALTWNGAAETDGKFDITLAGNGAHVITGGDMADKVTLSTGVAAGVTITGGKGGDNITVLGGNADTIVQAKGDSQIITTLNNGIGLGNSDVVNGAATTDLVNLGNGDIGAGDGTYNNVATMPSLPGDDKFVQVRGDFNTTTKAFTASATGADSLFVYDSDATDAVQYETIVLIGYSTDTTGAGVAAGVLTLQ